MIRIGALVGFGLLTAFSGGLAFAAAPADLLPAEKAFRADVAPEGTASVRLTLHAAPGYGIYRERFAIDPTSSGLRVVGVASASSEASGSAKPDQYRGRTTLLVTFDKPVPADFAFIATVQGCADVGVCYPPLRLRLAVSQ
jgi:thiol:disulfide interchange protein DsbD